MENLILEKNRLKEFLKSLAGAELIAPIQRGGRTAFEAVADIDAAAVDLDDYTAPVKGAMFPQVETLFHYDRREGGLRMDGPQQAPARVVFGIRPCDARSFVVLDPLFGGDVADPCYQSRRSATVLIGHSCAEPTVRCFCPSVGGSPSGSEGLDMLFTDIDAGYYVEVFTDQGSAVAEGAKHLLTAATDAHTRSRQQAAEVALSKIRRAVDLNLMHELLPKSFSASLWQDVANACIGCGICTYNCPTCHCFDIQDEGTPGQGRRVRLWDSCMYPEFTVHASGENPRKNRGDRIRNRLMHKFSYYPLNYGRIGCVGCGRCIELCPVNEDLIEILTSVREAIDE